MDGNTGGLEPELARSLHFRRSELEALWSHFDKYPEDREQFLNDTKLVVSYLPIDGRRHTSAGLWGAGTVGLMGGRAVAAGLVRRGYHAAPGVNSAGALYPACRGGRRSPGCCC